MSSRRRTEGEVGGGAGRRRRRSRSRRRRRGSGAESSAGEEEPGRAAKSGEDAYRLEICRERHGTAEPMFDIQIADDEGGAERIISHICARPGEGYVIRVTNASKRHIACAVTVDGENALLRDGSLIVAPQDSRELPGFLVSKNFVGREYVKEYRDFRFGKPKVVEGGNPGETVEEQPYTTYGKILCEVFEAVLDEEVDSDQELRGQTTFYRGAGLHGSFDERQVPEGKKKHFLYSSVTVQGPRSSIANSTRGRWWVRGTRRIRTIELRYREAHSLMLLGVDPKVLGLAHCKAEDGGRGTTKVEEDEPKKEEDPDDKLEKKLDDLKPGFVDLCDLTAEGAEAGEDSGSWSVVKMPSRAEPVDVAN